MYTEKMCIKENGVSHQLYRANQWEFAFLMILLLPSLLLAIRNSMHSNYNLYIP